MSQEDVRKASGLSITTIGKIERGEVSTVVQPATLNRLDLALRWTAGTARSWYEGRGGLVASAAPDDLERLARDLMPLLAGQLHAERQHSTLSIDGIPEGIVAALDQLMRAIRAELNRPR